MQESALKIRKATEADAARLHELHTISVRTLCKNHYRPEVIDGWLLSRSPQGYLRPIKRGDIFVAEQDSQIVGFGLSRFRGYSCSVCRSNSGWPACRYSILQYALQIAGDGHVGPIRLESTLNAVGFYEQFGFRELERITVQRGSAAVPCVLMQLAET